MARFKEFFGSESWLKFRGITLSNDSYLFGVCEALGGATPFAPWMWRTLFLATTFAWGVGVLAYLILWISIPMEEEGE